MNDPLVCAVLEGTTVEEMLDEAARANLAGADLAEVRFDRLYLIRPEDSEAPASEEEEGEVRQASKDPRSWDRKKVDDIDVNAVLEELKEGIPIPVIMTCRQESEGGFFPGKEKARTAILQAAIDSEVSWVDLEISIETDRRKELHTAASEKGVKVVASKHDIDGSPSTEEIVETAKANLDSGDLLKLCYRTSNNHDGLRIIEAAWELRGVESDLAIMGGGPGGDWTRLHAPILDQAMVYTTLRNEFRLSDEGLINVKDARNAWVLLEY